MPSIFDPASFGSQKSVAYRTFLLTGVQQAFNEVFAIHPDPFLKTQFDGNGNKIAGVGATLLRPTDALVYPCLVIRYIESVVRNAGVGHIEYIEDFDSPSGVTAFRHAHYAGQIEVGVYALSTLDMYLVADAVVQIMRMPDMAPYTNQYINQIFNDADSSNTLHYINIDTDVLRPTGDTTGQVPWGAENELEYRTGYRANVAGEFYSLAPGQGVALPITAVNVYPYIPPYEMIPAGKNPSDPAPWLP